ncbi:MAG TPA: hypothetical protein VEU51_01175 [Candidatus Acidoferrales bacterium]|nr:hypothetical protein [Candidatus Acidoferrales bacterium]
MPAPERLDLETSPRLETVATYVFTRASERSWQALNRHLANGAGSVFWIGGPAGCGKTHFLNYAIALQSRAGASSSEAASARRLICGLEVSGRVQAAEVELHLLSAVAEQIGAESRPGDLWREMRGADAFSVALESARRTGVRAVTAAIDFGLAECEAVADFFAMLAGVAEKSRHVKFTVLAAARDAAPPVAQALEVAPRDAHEEIAVAVRRARALADGAESAAANAYDGIALDGFKPDSIFPFHPATVVALRSIADGAVVVPTLSRMVRDVLAVAGDGDGNHQRLVCPADLSSSEAISKRVELRLGEPGRAALKMAHTALERCGAFERELAREIIDTLVVHAASGADTPLPVSELESRLPIPARNGAPHPSGMPVRELLKRLEANSGCVIRFEAKPQIDAAHFDPEAAGAPEVAAFNSALRLLRRFDPALSPARDVDALALRVEQLGNRLTDEVEAAHRVRAVLVAELEAANLRMPPDHSRAIALYLELVESGTAETIETGRDPARCEAAIRIVDSYEVLAASASAVPRMRAMREYLAGTGLRASGDVDQSRDSAANRMETECELLGIELGPRVLTGTMRNLDVLEARFQKFKWTYVQCYLSAHEKWRIEIERAALAAGDARRHAEALGRLNAIRALGAPAGAGLAERLAELGAHVRKCEPAGPLSPEIVPRCPSCDFALGAVSPRAELAEVLDLLKRALAVKLAALSQSMIARLIREHDQNHRLDGFLKITQAAQTDALVQVLDEGLARYLAGVLDENRNAPELTKTPKAVLKSVKRR